MDYGAVYAALVQKALDRGWSKKTAPVYTEYHHITPKCMGGWEGKDNLVCFSAREHILAHLLLAKMYPGIPGLVYAVTMMCGDKTSRTYSEIRERHKNERSYYSKNIWNPMMDPDRVKTWRGEGHPASKLSEETVKKIKHLHASGLSNKEISRITGVYHQQVYNITSGRTWKHVSPH